jgi:hypothetical protein
MSEAHDVVNVCFGHFSNGIRYKILVDLKDTDLVSDVQPISGARIICYKYHLEADISSADVQEVSILKPIKYKKIKKCHLFINKNT